MNWTLSSVFIFLTIILFKGESLMADYQQSIPGTAQKIGRTFWRRRPTTSGRNRSFLDG
jgi:hypothetical protein